MSDIIKMDYGMMEDMNRTFLQGVEQMQDTMQQMQSIANTFEDGALLGKGGSYFTDAVRGKLCPAIARLIEKFEELANDVNDAARLMQEAEESNVRNF